MKYELNAYAKSNDTVIKFFQNTELEDLYAPYFHVTLTNKYHDHEFDAHFAQYQDAVNLFKAKVKEFEIKEVFIAPDFMAWLKGSEEWEELPPTQEEEYYDACMASEHGDESLMERYNRKYGIEKDYSPSNPWDAPGMKVSDFI